MTLVFVYSSKINVLNLIHTKIYIILSLDVLPENRHVVAGWKGFCMSDHEPVIPLFYKITWVYTMTWPVDLVPNREFYEVILIRYINLE